MLPPPRGGVSSASGCRIGIGCAGPGASRAPRDRLGDGGWGLNGWLSRVAGYSCICDHSRPHDCLIFVCVQHGCLIFVCVQHGCLIFVCVRLFSTTLFGLPFPSPCLKDAGLRHAGLCPSAKIECYARQHPGHGGHFGMPAKDRVPGLQGCPKAKTPRPTDAIFRIDGHLPVVHSAVWRLHPVPCQAPGRPRDI